MKNCEKGLLERIQGIDGFLTDREASVLFNLAKRTCSGCIVEIGSWQGKSTVCLGYGTKAGHQLKIHAIDPHTGSEEHQREGQKVWTFQKFEENMRGAGLEGSVFPIVDFAQNARKRFDQPIGMLFIDGAHDYISVKQDYELWSPLVVNGGYIVFHDTQWAGVSKVCDEVLSKDGFRKVFFQDTICYGIKTARASAVDRFRARGILRLKNIFYDANGSALPKWKKKIIKEYVKLLRAFLMFL